MAVTPQRATWTLILVVAASLSTPLGAFLDRDSSAAARTDIAWSTSIASPVISSPVAAGDLIIVTTASDRVFALRASDGDVVWSTTLGRPEPAGSGRPLGCNDVAPAVGILARPAIDLASDEVFVSDRQWDGRSPSSARWLVHALSLRTGREKGGWPVSIEGTASNDQSIVFDGIHELQRPAVGLEGGRLYLGFGGICDRPPFRGWIANVDINTRAVKLWTDEAVEQSDSEGGIWESGSELAFGSSGDLFVSTGNGLVPPPGPANTNVKTYGNSVLRLRVAPDGAMHVLDYFTPWQGGGLNERDLDLGSGGPLLLPPSMSIPGHPHLLVQTSKSGNLYILDSDNLGGEGQGPRGTDRVIAETGPYEAAFSQAASWPAGSMIYVTGTVTLTTPGFSPTLRAYKFDTGGIRLVASAGGTFGYGSSSPMVLSNGGGQAATVWVLERPAGNEAQAELREYAAKPNGTSLTLLRHYGVGAVPRFAAPLRVGDRMIVVGSLGTVTAFSLDDASQGQGNNSNGVVAIALPLALMAAILIAALLIRRRLLHLSR